MKLLLLQLTLVLVLYDLPVVLLVIWPVLTTVLQIVHFLSNHLNHDITRTFHINSYILTGSWNLYCSGFMIEPHYIFIVNWYRFDTIKRHVLISITCLFPLGTSTPWASLLPGPSMPHFNFNEKSARETKVTKKKVYCWLGFLLQYHACDKDSMKCEVFS
jgi:hypothetical protein